MTSDRGFHVGDASPHVFVCRPAKLSQKLRSKAATSSRGNASRGGSIAKRELPALVSEGAAIPASFICLPRSLAFAAAATQS